MNEENPNLESLEVAQPISETPTRELNIGRQDQPTKGTVDISNQYKQLQTEFLRRNEELEQLKQFKDQVSPNLEVFNKLQSVFSNEVKEPNFWQALPDKFQSLQGENSQLQQALEATRQETAQVRQYLAAQQENQAFQQFEDNYSERFASAEDFEQFKGFIKETIPNALDQFRAGRSLDSLANEALGQVYADPNSALNKSIQRAKEVKLASKRYNTVSGQPNFGSASSSSPFGDQIVTVTPSERF